MHSDLMFDSLDGLSVGDALGQHYPVLRMRRPAPDLRDDFPAGQWGWTDDTEMACSVVAELAEHGRIDPNRLASAFARRCDPARDYGFTAAGILRRIRDGAHWRDVSAAVFEHQGSCGNGAAMRVAPLGAFYAGDPERAVTEAVRSAQVTHFHPEGVVGAVAVALAAARAGHARLTGIRPTPAEFITDVLDRLDDGETSRRIRRARSLLGAAVEEVAGELGNGSRVTAPDTVPFTIWASATHLGDYPSGITTCLAADGDIDTTAAITGGIVAAYTGGDSWAAGIPSRWFTAREPLPRWFDPSLRTVAGRSRPGRLRRWFSGAS